MAGQVLVSGGSGYIAGFLIRQLVDEGWSVHTTSVTWRAKPKCGPRLE